MSGDAANDDDDDDEDDDVMSPSSSSSTVWTSESDRHHAQHLPLIKGRERRKISNCFFLIIEKSRLTTYTSHQQNEKIGKLPKASERTIFCLLRNEL